MSTLRNSFVQKTPGVCGGRACVRDTRIPVWTIIAMRLKGYLIKQVRENYPGLTEDDYWECAVYYGLHMEEIKQDIQDQKETSDGN